MDLVVGDLTISWTLVLTTLVGLYAFGVAVFLILDNRSPQSTFAWLFLLLAFPMGRLEPPAARWPMYGAVVGVVAFFLPWALLAPVIAGGGPLVRCAPACPSPSPACRSTANARRA